MRYYEMSVPKIGKFAFIIQNIIDFHMPTVDRSMRGEMVVDFGKFCFFFTSQRGIRLENDRVQYQSLDESADTLGEIRQRHATNTRPSSTAGSSEGWVSGAGDHGTDGTEPVHRRA
jgi:hypothetical protein